MMNIIAEIIRKIILVFGTILIVTVFINIFVFDDAPKEAETEKSFIRMDIGDTTCTEIVDFLYDFSRDHRLDLHWFGWCHNPNSTTWFEHPEEASIFNVKMYMLNDEKNGSLFVTYGVDEQSVGVSIDPGRKKKSWLDTVDGFQKQIADKGWTKK